MTVAGDLKDEVERDVQWLLDYLHDWGANIARMQAAYDPLLQRHQAMSVHDKEINRKFRAWQQRYWELGDRIREAARNLVYPVPSDLLRDLDEVEQALAALPDRKPW